MKYLTILIDGMADESIESLGGKTPLEYSSIPCIDEMARKSELGMVHTVPQGMQPGSDVANLSVMGYAPDVYHTGRSPLEAVSVGVKLEDTDVTFRCNLVTVSNEEGLDYQDRTMLDHSAGEITSEEAEELINFLKPYLEKEELKYYPGVSYRNLIVWENGNTDMTLVPPHDFLEKKIGEFLPQGNFAKEILEMTKKSFELLSSHPINIKRISEGKNPANSIWIWGEGKKPILDPFQEKYKLKGAVISAVDLIKGIAISASLESIDIEGATGNIDTNFEGKAQGVIGAFERGNEFVYLHLEAPDECGHQGDLKEKIRSIEIIDEKIVKVLKAYLDSLDEEYRILLVPDHPTPVRIRTHTMDAVPYLIYDSSKAKQGSQEGYSEVSCALTNNVFNQGFKLAEYFLEKC